MLAVGILLLIAIVAVGVGIARNSSKSKPDNATTATSTATTKPGATASPGCASGTWPALYQGKPQNLDAAKDTGFYLWNEVGGWHLRALDTASTTTFHVVITASSKLDAKTFKAVPANAFPITVTANTASFDMPGTPTAAGIDFTVPCSVTQIRVDMGTLDLPWPANGIWIGKDNTAVTNPVVPQKQAN